MRALTLLTLFLGLSGVLLISRKAGKTSSLEEPPQLALLEASPKQLEAGTATPPMPAPPSTSELLRRALSDRDKRYNPEVGLLKGRGGGPGYSTRMTADQIVHPTEDSAKYAQLLLMRGEPDDVARASRILTRLVELQVTDTNSKFYGIWGWFLEEPPEKMAPADWNWADFIGARLADILVNHADKLDPALREKLKESLRHAARSIVKRNVGPGYTNICAMGAAVTMAAGEILSDPGLLQYGRKRIAAQRAAMERDGGVPEYNSPPYGLIFQTEMERVLRLVKDPEGRSHARWMWERMWKLTADQFHPGTGQWAGAQSRTYSDRLRPNQAYFLWTRTGVAPRGAEKMEFSLGPDDLQTIPELVLPNEVANRLRQLPSEPYEIKQGWVQAKGAKPAVVLHSWFSDQATLGSVNQETTWVQHRVVTGFWPVGSRDVASLKVSFLKDDKEFASGLIRSHQNGPRLLAVLGMATGQGDWHCSIDRPADGVFTGKDLRLRVSLSAPGAELIERPEGQGWILTAGEHQVVVHPGAVYFNGVPGRWEAGRKPGGVYVDAILKTGEPHSFRPATLQETTAGLALELLPIAAQPENAPVQSELRNEERVWRWAPVEGEISAPIRIGEPQTL